ncbi:transposable element Tcb1 transposase [Elysia marginata]|uniref:Transposable element Tcb1 transposase n=1 Tax=Elysia marginata TaxID=1093978 RepID=A0AAV4HJD8_9GAST|nr:transposable element Tcb1 transposase [Elysia marginata]
MTRLRENERNRLIGMIRGGVSVSTVAHHFNVTRRTVYVTLQRERATGSQKDRPRRLDRRKTTDREDTFIRLSHLRDRFKTASQTMAEINIIRQNNPISKWTQFWDLLDRRVRMRQPQPQTLLQLERALHEEWDNIPQQAVHRLIGSMQRRCQAVILSRGHHTRY